MLFDRDIDPSLRMAALIMPRGTGLITRHLGLARAAASAADRVLGLRDVEQVAVSATAGVRVHRPGGATTPRPALLWIHGGGYVVGSARLGDRMMRRMARTLGAVVASVEYRLAPEHPYPAALDDCWAALNWLVNQADIDSHRIVVAGPSAGGGLAAALTLRTVDTGLTKLAGQVLQYPMLDDRTALRSFTPRLGWTPADNDFGWRSYLAATPGSDGISSYAAPARRKDLSGLPSTWIGVGAADLFFDEGIAYAKRLTAAGVATELEVVQGAFHGFDIASRAKLSRRFIDARMTATRRLLHANPLDPDREELP
jgi:acetyl esterase/lipase